MILELEDDESEVQQISELCDIEEILKRYKGFDKHKDQQFEAYKEASTDHLPSSEGIVDLFDRS